MVWLSLIFGAVVGLSLGLTGGGGTVFAVLLLIYGMGLDAHEAVTVSLAAVGVTACIGFIHRWKLGEVEVRTGLIFAFAGMLGAPLGTWFASLMTEVVLMLMFACLMIIVASRMWQQAARAARNKKKGIDPDADKRPTCRRDANGQLIMNTRCAILLIFAGVLTGILSGMFGVGGGFIIVPALILFSGMTIHRALGTSLMVIALVSVSGVTAQLWSGRNIPVVVTLLFIVGGIAGMFAGQRIGRRLSGPTLQKGFAIAILAVAVFVIYRNLNP